MNEKDDRSKGNFFSKFWNDLQHNTEKIKDSLVSAFKTPLLASKKDVHYFTRLICCKLNTIEYLPEAIEGLHGLGFSNITDDEPFGRRGSKIMFEYRLPDLVTRLHVRVHIIDKSAFFLVHKEPVPSKNMDDIVFHVRGFLERVTRDFNSFVESKKEPDRATVNYDQEAEMSDYESGCRLFRDLLKESNPDLYTLFNFYLDDADFLSFSLKFGNVSKVLPVEMLLNDFRVNLKNDDDLNLGNNIQTVMETLGFKRPHRLHLKPKLDLIKAYPSARGSLEDVIDILDGGVIGHEMKLFIIFTRSDAIQDFFDPFIEYCKGDRGFYFLIIYKTSRNLKLQEEKRYKKKDIFISYISISNFQVLFETFLNAPFSSEKVLGLMRSNVVITGEEIHALKEEKLDTNQITRLVSSLLEFLGENPGWHSLKVLREVITKNKETGIKDDATMDHVFDLLKNPLFELVDTRKDGKEIRGISNKEELKLKINQMKKVFGGIDSLL
nr:hypothetical protein [Candidatus Sigynarchaeota archaeon]